MTIDEFVKVKASLYEFFTLGIPNFGSTTINDIWLDRIGGYKYDDVMDALRQLKHSEQGLCPPFTVIQAYVERPNKRMKRLEMATKIIDRGLALIKRRAPIKESDEMTMKLLSDDVAACLRLEKTGLDPVKHASGKTYAKMRDIAISNMEKILESRGVNKNGRQTDMFGQWGNK